MKLELKHLVPYFDYYLECIILETNERVLLESMNNDLHYQSYSFSSLNGSAKAENALLLEEHFKPILRPLSDLKKINEENKPMFFASHQLIRHIENKKDG